MWVILMNMRERRIYVANKGKAEFILSTLRDWEKKGEFNKWRDAVKEASRIADEVGLIIEYDLEDANRELMGRRRKR